MGDLSHFVVRPGLRPLEITPRDLAPFLRHNGRLNGFGLNGVAASVHTLSSGDFSPTKATANQCAVFSTYDLPCVRYKGSDPDLWRLVSPTQYWEKPLWLIPIHRPQLEHWVLVVVVVPTRELFFFDSMASRRGWRKDLHVRLPPLLSSSTDLYTGCHGSHNTIGCAVKSQSTPAACIHRRSKRKVGCAPTFHCGTSQFYTLFPFILL
jgi:hypothetical protein